MVMSLWPRFLAHPVDVMIEHFRLTQTEEVFFIYRLLFKDLITYVLNPVYDYYV